MAVKDGPAHLGAQARIHSSLIHFENTVAGLALFLTALLPFLEIFARKIFKTSIPGAGGYLPHLLLWITFLGGAITSREGKHIALTAGVDQLRDPYRRWIRIVTSLISVMICTAFTWSSISLVLIGFDPSTMIGAIPIQWLVVIIPIGFGLMTIRFIARSAGVRDRGDRNRGDRERRGHERWLVSLGVLLGTFLAFSSVANILYTITFDLPLFIDTLSELSFTVASVLNLPLILILVAAALLGSPIFIALGGIAYLLFAGSGGSLEVIPSEAYSMLTSHSIPAIPLFALTGFILSESKAGERLVRLFQAFFGWVPGGLVIMTVLVCAFFTTFTGASGVTILALGALLSYILVKSGKYSKSFSNGLVTSSGSIGLLFPPSLPIILYGVTAQINIKHMFIAGIIPGIVLVLVLSLIGIFTAIKRKVSRISFKPKEALGAFKESIWEILLPVIIILGYFAGITTLVETAAVAVVYTLIVEVFIHRDLKLKDLQKVFDKCIPIIGGILIILAVAKGLSYYLVDVEIPMRLSTWARETIHSKYLFLLLLNVALLITGCLMDIFSAILVMVPLIVPLGAAFGIDPIHLGIIFLANLELGYLTPPVGLNLFLAAYRFEVPLVKIYKDVLPFFFVLLVAVLLITYLPWISTGFLSLLGL